MKNITTPVCGFDFPVSGVPETLVEVVQVAGGEPQVVTIFNSHVRFHRTNTEIRSAASEAIAKITGIERTKKQVKVPTSSDPNRMAEAWGESEQTHIDRALAEKSLRHEDVADEVIAAVGITEFKAVGEPRVAGPGKLAKVYTEAAEKLIAAGPAKYGNAVTLLEQANPGTTITLDANGAPVLESLAAALKVNRARVEKEADAALGIEA